MGEGIFMGTSIAATRSLFEIDIIENQNVRVLSARARARARARHPCKHGVPYGTLRERV